MALLKIIYFAHGWYLAHHSQALVAQPIEAWKYGPVVKVVRDAFKLFENQPITTRAEKLVLQTGELIRVEPNLSRDDRDFVESIYRSYIVHGAWELSEMTHEANSPWDKVWNPKTPIGRIGLRIKNDEIRHHFISMSERSMLQ
jgi:uncharacterized phage-associated protein